MIRNTFLLNCIKLRPTTTAAKINSSISSVQCQYTKLSNIIQYLWIELNLIHNILWALSIQSGLFVQFFKFIPRRTTICHTIRSIWNLCPMLQVPFQSVDKNTHPTANDCFNFVNMQHLFQFANPTLFLSLHSILHFHYIAFNSHFVSARKSTCRSKQKWTIF